MAAIGGSIRHANLGGRLFPIVADGDSQRTLGGMSNKREPNGDGSSRVIKTATVPMIETLTVVIDDLRGDQEYLQDLADQTEDFEFSIEYASGAVYQGVGSIEEEVKFSSQSASASLGIAGSGRLTRQ